MRQVPGVVEPGLVQPAECLVVRLSTWLLSERETAVFNLKSCHKIVGLTFLGFLVTLPAFADTDSECLQTKEGNPLKVIVREHAALFEKPDKASPSRPVRQFEFFYVLPPQK